MKKRHLFVSLLLVIGGIFLVGCSCTQKTAKDEVEDFLNQYKNLSSSVLTNLEDVIENENLNDEQSEKYRDILKKQYSDLTYEIIDETYDGDTAIVKTKITVYDLYKVQKDAAEHLNANMDEFKDEDGNYDNDEYLDYKLEKMKNNTETVEYTIEFNVIKNENDNWEVTELNESDLEKIHGIYNYDNE